MGVHLVIYTELKAYESNYCLQIKHVFYIEKFTILDFGAYLPHPISLKASKYEMVLTITLQKNTLVQRAGTETYQNRAIHK